MPSYYPEVWSIILQRHKLNSWLFCIIDSTVPWNPDLPSFPCYLQTQTSVSDEHCQSKLTHIYTFLKIFFFLFTGTKKRSHDSPAPSTSSTSRLTLPGRSMALPYYLNDHRQQKELVFQELGTAAVVGLCPSPLFQGALCLLPSLVTLFQILPYCFLAMDLCSFLGSL